MKDRSLQRLSALVTTLAVIGLTFGVPSSSADEHRHEGYWMAAADGGVFAFGDAPFLGSLADVRLAAPIIGIAPTPSGRGYWLAAADGGVFAFGDAPFLGSAAGNRLNRPAVGIAPSPTGRGYWLAAADGGVFAFGDAPFLGRCYDCVREHPIVGIAASPVEVGYWLMTRSRDALPYGSVTGPEERCFPPYACDAIAIAPSPAGGFVSSTGEVLLRFGDAPDCSDRLPDRVPELVAVAVTGANDGCWALAADGGVLTFGNAPFLGSAAGAPFRAPPVAMAALPGPRPPSPPASGPAREGYWIAGADGGVFAFGDAPFLGSAAGEPLNRPVVDMVPTPSGNGYWLVAADGGVFAFGDAPFLGSLAGAGLDAPVTAIAATTTGRGYWVTVADGRLFPFGDAPYLEGCGSCRYPAFPLKDVAAMPDGSGYWLLGAHSSVTPHGAARLIGYSYCRYPPECASRLAASPAGGLVLLEAGDLSSEDCGFLERLLSPRLLDVAVGSAGEGCLVLGADGDVITRPGARFLGSLVGATLPTARPSPSPPSLANTRTNR